MKVLDRNDNRYILEPLKQYLQNEGIQSEVILEWKTGRMCGPYVLVVNDEVYDEAVRAIGNIDTSVVDDGVTLTDESGRTPAEIRKRYDNISKWAARLLLIVIVAYVIYMAIK